MNVATITMPKEEAQAKLEAYREQNKKRVDMKSTRLPRLATLHLPKVRR